MSFHPFVHHVNRSFGIDLVGLVEQIVVIVVRSWWAVVGQAFDASSVTIAGDDELVDLEIVVLL